MLRDSRDIMLASYLHVHVKEEAAPLFGRSPLMFLHPHMICIDSLMCAWIILI